MKSEGLGMALVWIKDGRIFILCICVYCFVQNHLPCLLKYRKKTPLVAYVKNVLYIPRRISRGVAGSSSVLSTSAAVEDA